MPLQLISLVVGTRDVVPINPMGGQALVSVASGGGNLFYSDNRQVSSSSNQGTINAGSSLSFTRMTYVIASAAGTNVSMQVADADTLSNLNWPYRI